MWAQPSPQLLPGGLHLGGAGNVNERFCPRRGRVGAVGRTALHFQDSTASAEQTPRCLAEDISYKLHVKHLSAIGQALLSLFSSCAPTLPYTLTYLHPHLPSTLSWKAQGNQNDFLSEAVQLSLQGCLGFVCATLSTMLFAVYTPLV